MTHRPGNSAGNALVETINTALVGILVFSEIGHPGADFTAAHETAVRLETERDWRIGV